MKSMRKTAPSSTALISVEQPCGNVSEKVSASETIPTCIISKEGLSSEQKPPDGIDR